MKYKYLLLFFCLFFVQSLHAQRIALVGAMDQEIAILLEAMGKPKKTTHGGIDFYTGKLMGKKVVVVKSGVGKVNAAYSTAVLIENFSPSKLIFTGVAGGLHPEALPGDLVIGEALVQYDFGKIDSLGFEVAPFPKLLGGRHEELNISSDAALVRLSQKIAQEMEFLAVAGRQPKVFSGVIATGDVFVSSNEKAAWLNSEFQALATEMEGAAIAHICRSLNVPFIVIRSCSDNANNHARLSFNQFVGPASANSAKLVMGMLKVME